MTTIQNYIDRVEADSGIYEENVCYTYSVFEEFEVSSPITVTLEINSIL